MPLTCRLRCSGLQCSGDPVGSRLTCCVLAVIIWRPFIFHAHSSMGGPLKSPPTSKIVDLARADKHQHQDLQRCLDRMPVRAGAGNNNGGRGRGPNNLSRTTSCHSMTAPKLPDSQPVLCSWTVKMGLSCKFVPLEIPLGLSCRRQETSAISVQAISHR